MLKFEFRKKNSEIRIKVNSKFESVKKQEFKKLKVYSADPWYQPARAQSANIIINTAPTYSNQIARCAEIGNP